MVSIFYLFIGISLMLVAGAGVYGAVIAHQAASGKLSGRALAVPAFVVACVIGVACLVAFITSGIVSVLAQFV